MYSGVVYRIVDTVSGDGYVGATQNPAHRWKQHCAALNGGWHSNKRLQAAWDAHGAASFRFTILEPVVEVLDLRAREAAYIALPGLATLNTDSRDGSGLPNRFQVESGRVTLRSLTLADIEALRNAEPKPMGEEPQA